MAHVGHMALNMAPAALRPPGGTDRDTRGADEPMRQRLSMYLH
jgi:hypothetical protein